MSGDSTVPGSALFQARLAAGTKAPPVASADQDAVDRSHSVEATPDESQTTPSNASSSNALSELYRSHAASLRAYVGKLVGAGPPDPDDVVQEAFEKVSKAASLHELSCPHAFLWRTAQNIVASEYRSASVRARYAEHVAEVFYPEQGDGYDPQRVLLARLELSGVLRTLKTMDQKRRIVFLLSRVEGMSLTDICQQLGISRSAVSKRLSAALLELYRATQRETGA